MNWRQGPGEPVEPSRAVRVPCRGRVVLLGDVLRGLAWPASLWWQRLQLLGTHRPCARGRASHAHAPLAALIPVYFSTVQTTPTPRLGSQQTPTPTALGCGHASHCGLGVRHSPTCRPGRAHPPLSGRHPACGPGGRGGRATPPQAGGHRRALRGPRPPNRGRGVRTRAVRVRGVQGGSGRVGWLWVTVI